MSEEKRTCALFLGDTPIFGPGEIFPKVGDFQGLVVAHKNKITPALLSSLAYQTVLQAPHKLIAQYLQVLTCLYWTLDVSQLGELADSGVGSKICGKIFKRGEIVWTCKQCGMDPTCVQCDDCFKSSDHTGHEVYFHKSGTGGGCCDCGDPEAWMAGGTCPNHGKKSNEKGEIDAICDSVAELPVELVDGTTATATGVFLALNDFIVKSVRGFEPLEKNRFVTEGSNDDKLCLRLFNDDYHTYSEVSDALKQCGLSGNATNAMTRLVDKVGSAKVASGNAQEMRVKYEKLRPRLHLLVSVVPESVVGLESAMLNVLHWIQDFSAIHDGLRRILTTVFINRTAQLSPDVLLAVSAASDGISAGFYHPIDDIVASHSTAQFPLSIPVLDCRPTPPARSGRNALVFDTANIGSLGSDVLAQHPEIFCPLSILMASSHFLTKPLQECLNHMLVSGLRDDVFRRVFTQILTMLYPTLHKQFCVGLGTSELSILQSTCQVYTANSLTVMMSSAGVSQRLLPPSSDSECYLVHISTVIMQSALQCIRLSGISNCISTETHAKDYKNSCIIAHDRYRQSLQDIGHIMKCPDFILGALCGEIDPGTIDVFLKFCKELSGIDGYKCIRTGSHIEIEESSWKSALKVALELENTSTGFLDDGFFLQRSRDMSDDKHSAKKRQALNYLVSKTVGVLREGWENDCLRMSPSVDGETLVSIGPGTSVSASIVSIHNTLEKFLAKCIVTAAKAGINFSLKDFDGIYGFMLAETALRSFAFVAQVHCQIWVRNGLAPLHISSNFEYPPLCLMFRDIELHVLQIALNEYKDKSSFLNTARFIFELCDTPFGDLNTVPMAKKCIFRDKKTSIYLASELLRLLISMLTQLPVDFVSNEGQGLRGAIRREIIHQLLSGVRSRSKLQIIKSLLGCPEGLVSESLLQSVISDLCEPSDQEGTVVGGPGKLVLQPQFVLEYDPENSHVMSDKKQTTFDTVLETRKSLRRDIGKYKILLPPLPWPVISCNSISLPHSAFGGTRSLLYCEAFTDFLKYLVVSVMPGAEISSRSLQAGGQIVITRVIYLLTLQLHCYSETIGHVRQLSSMPVYATNCDHHQEVLNFDTLSVSQTEGSMYGLLEALADVFLNGYIASDDFYQEGLDFVLSEYCKRSSLIKRMCTSKDLRLSGLSEAEVRSSSSGDSLKRRRDEAMSRAMTLMRKKAAQFFEDNNIAIPKALSTALTQVDPQGELPNVSVLEDTSETDKDIGEIESDAVICIVCRENESPSRPCGYLSLVQGSSALANAIKFSNNEDKFNEEIRNIPSPNSVYRVVATAGAAVMSSPSDRSRKIATLDFGAHIIVSRRRHGSNWVEISSPVVGWSVLYRTADVSEAPLDGSAPGAGVTPSISDSRSTALSGLASAVGEVWRRQLGGLFPNAGAVDASAEVSKSAVTTIPVLFPVKELMFNRYGANKPHVSSCGHAMHFSCYDDFFAASMSKKMLHTFYEHIMTSDSQYCCPMCNAVGNSLIPDLKFDAPMGENIPILPTSFLLDEREIPLCLDSPLIKADNTISQDRVAIDTKNRILAFSDHILSLSQDRSPLVKLAETNTGRPRIKQLDLFMQLQASWTGTAHTILLASCNQRWWRDDSTCDKFLIDGVSISPQNLRLASRLLNINMKLYNLFSIQDYENAVLGPLRSLVFPVKPSGGIHETGAKGAVDYLIDISADTPLEVSRKILAHLPNVLIPSSTFQSEIYRGVVSSIEQHCLGDSPPCSLWSFLQQPLLSHDLHVLAVACVSNSKLGRGNVLHILQVMCIARIVQIMIEPAASYDAILLKSQRLDKLDIDQRSLTFPFYDTWLEVRSIRCGITTISDSSRRLATEQALIHIVVDSLLPFLEFCVNLLQAYEIVFHEAYATTEQAVVESKSPESGSKSTYETIISNTIAFSRLPTLLDVLGLPAVDVLVGRCLPCENLAEKTAIAEIVSNWCELFKLFHAEINTNTSSPLTCLAIGSVNYKNHCDDILSSKKTEFGTEVNENDTVHDGTDTIFAEEGCDMELVDGVAGFTSFIEGGDDIDDFYDSDDSAQERFLHITAGSINKKVGWPYVGVDPSYNRIDQCGIITSVPLYPPFLGSISGTHVIFDNFGRPLQHLFFDMSSFCISQHHKASFIALPNLFTEVYQQYKLPDIMNGVEERRSTALCLICGQTLQAGNRDVATSARGRLTPGECTLHSYSCGAGNGVYLLIEDCKCLLVNGPLQVYAPSIYTTADGENVDIRHSTRPLYLNSVRVDILQKLYFQQKIASEVCQKRSTETHISVLSLHWWFASWNHLCKPFRSHSDSRIILRWGDGYIY